MNVDYLVLADAAAAENGKLYIHGAGWDTIYAANFPVMHPQLSAAIRFRIAYTETNQPHRLRVDIVDADEQSILPNPPGPVEGDVNVGRPPQLEPGNDQVIPLVINFAQLRFDGPGTYVVVVSIDGLAVARAPFFVRQLAGAILA